MDKDETTTTIAEPVTKKNLFRPKHLTPTDIREGCITLTGGNGIETQICVAQEELRQGMNVVEDYKNSITIYGSARLQPGTEYYEKTRNLAARISNETGYAIITGGGPGIMEAANRGAFEMGGASIGLPIVLPKEQKTNPYVTEEVPFYFFFTRKVTLSYSSKILIACPGGFGTFDEIFEVITLMQTKKIMKHPIILFGSDFWQPFVDLIKTIMLDKFQTISPDDMDLFKVTDSEDEIMGVLNEIITKEQEVADTSK